MFCCKEGRHDPKTIYLQNAGSFHSQLVVVGASSAQVSHLGFQFGAPPLTTFFSSHSVRSPSAIAGQYGERAEHTDTAAQCLQSGGRNADSEGQED